LFDLGVDGYTLLEWGEWLRAEFVVIVSVVFSFCDEGLLHIH